ncbi:MAG: HAD-IA family hydrolase [Rugosibacter sp.]|nr:HAD-IA family hydrolase [Rugosibacter sp.]
MPEAILFDLDGTLADTVPDLGGATNLLRAEHGLPPLSLEYLRPHASAGARGLLKAGLNITPDNADYPVMQQRFLALYENNLCLGSHLFQDIPELLDAIEAQGIHWGIVTNKVARFTIPLVAALGLARRANCIISGDSTPRPKPFPDSLQLASTSIGVDAARCIYVGDDERDVIAGRSAGMKTIIALWGYLGTGKSPADWGGDASARTPRDILRIATANL